MCNAATYNNVRMSLFIIHCIQLDFDIALEVVRLAARIGCEMEGSGGGMDDVSLHIDRVTSTTGSYI